MGLGPWQRCSPVWGWPHPTGLGTGKDARWAGAGAEVLAGDARPPPEPVRTDVAQGGSVVALRGARDGSLVRACPRQPRGRSGGLACARPRWWPRMRSAPVAALHLHALSPGDSLGRSLSTVLVRGSHGRSSHPTGAKWEEARELGAWVAMEEDTLQLVSMGGATGRPDRRCWPEREERAGREGLLMGNIRIEGRRK